MRRDKHGQNLKGFASETVANLKPGLARFPILTIKSSLSISLRHKRETSGGRKFTYPGWARFSIDCTSRRGKFGSTSFAFGGSGLNEAQRNLLSGG